MAKNRNPDDLNVLQQARDAMELTLDQVADSVGSNGASISRIERALQMGRRELYRALFEFYGGVLSLGEIYDPTFHEGKLDDRRRGKLRKLARSYRQSGRFEPVASG